MAITAYTGLPGAGKSYEVVNGPIWKAVGRSRVVWTNIPVSIAGVHVVNGADALGHWYLKAPAGALVVIDECWRYWPAGMKADQIPEEIKEWFAMHRHRTDGDLSTEVAIVTQDLSQIAAFVRALVEKTYRMKKIMGFGFKKTYRVDVYNGAVTGQRPPQAQHMNGWITQYKPEGFKRYQSHTQGGEAKEVDADKRGGILTRPIVLAIPAMLVALIAAPFLLSALFGAEEGGEAPPVERSETVAPPAPPAPAPVVQLPPAPVQAPEPPKAPEVEASTRWTLLGVIVKEDGDGIALLQNATGRRRVSVKESCSRGAAGEWACLVDGERVAMWTGSMSMLAQGNTYIRKTSQ